MCMKLSCVHLKLIVSFFCISFVLKGAHLQDIKTKTRRTTTSIKVRGELLCGYSLQIIHIFFFFFFLPRDRAMWCQTQYRKRARSAYIEATGPLCNLPNEGYMLRISCLHGTVQNFLTYHQLYIDKIGAINPIHRVQKCGH